MQHAYASLNGDHQQVDHDLGRYCQPAPEHSKQARHIIHPLIYIYSDYMFNIKSKTRWKRICTRKIGTMPFTSKWSWEKQWKYRGDHLFMSFWSSTIDVYKVVYGFPLSIILMSRIRWYSLSLPTTRKIPRSLMSEQVSVDAHHYGKESDEFVPFADKSQAYEFHHSISPPSIKQRIRISSQICKSKENPILHPSLILSTHTELLMALKDVSIDIYMIEIGVEMHILAWSHW